MEGEDVEICGTVGLDTEYDAGAIGDEDGSVECESR